MKRRNALKGLTLALGGLVSLPAWATGWTPETVGRQSHASPSDEALLAELVETFIPETNTPGAKSLGVHQFVLRMINDCYDKPAQELFRQGLLKTDELARQAYGQHFAACDARQRTELLRQMSTGTDGLTRPFADLVKALTVRGYTNSEYYLVNVQKYVMAPGYYHGCVSLITN